MAKLTAATKGIELISGLNTFFSLIVYTVDHFDVKLALIKRIVNCVFQFLPILPRYKHTEYDKFDHCFPGQNGILVRF